jgi:serine/threonine-protein kinase RsbW
VSEVTSSVLVLPTDLGELAVLETQIAALLAVAPAIEDAEIVQYNLWLAVHELCVNIIKHAYDGAPGEFVVTFRLLDDPWHIEITSDDQGRNAFDFSEWSPPDLIDPPIHGLGIFLMRQLMDSVAYEHTVTGSHWRLVKHLTVAYPAADTRSAPAGTATLIDGEGGNP